jgi:hypothetical protein
MCQCSNNKPSGLEALPAHGESVSMGGGTMLITKMSLAVELTARPITKMLWRFVNK